MANQPTDWRDYLSQECAILSDDTLRRLVNLDLRISRLPPGEIKDVLNERLARVARSLAENPSFVEGPGPRIELENAESPGEPVFESENISQRRIGIILVHGIGPKQSGEIAMKFIENTRGIFRDYEKIPHAPEDDPIDNAQKVFRSKGHEIRIYEAFWAKLLNEEEVKGGFQIHMMQQLPWFPILNLRARNSLNGYLHYPWWLVPLWTVLLVLLSGGLFFMILASGVFASSRGTSHRQDATVRVRKGTPSKSIQDKDNDTRNFLTKSRGFLKEWYRQARESADSSAQGDKWVKEKLDEYGGDVDIYINSLGGALPANSVTGHDSIIRQFYGALNQACKDQCTEVQIVAHSFGSVIAYHGLIGYILKDEDTVAYEISEDSPRITRFYTVGSPLEKIRFFWPKLTPPKPIGQLRLVNGVPKMLADGVETGMAHEFHWDNFHNGDDWVSGKLTRFDFGTNVINHSCRGTRGFLSSHVNYERDPEFLKVFREGLFGKSDEPPVTQSTRIWNAMFSLGESLFVPLTLPLTLVSLVALGVALVVLMIWIVGVLLAFVVTQSFQWFFPLMGGMVIAGIIWVVEVINGGLTAHNNHKKFWRTERHIPAAHSTPHELSDTSAIVRSG